MNLSYRITFLCNGSSKLIIHQKALYDTFLWKTCKVVKYFRNKEKLNEVLQSNQRRFQKLEKRAVDVIEVITNAGIKYDEREVEVDVCQAIQEIREEERQLGELKKSKEAARNFYEMGIEIEKVAQGVGYTVETVKQWLGLSDDSQ